MVANNNENKTERFYMKHFKTLVICVILIFTNTTMIGQNIIKRTSKDVCLKASFEKDTLDLTGKNDIIVDLEIINNSDSVFIFHPNANFNILEEYDGKGFYDRFGINLDRSKEIRESIKVLPYSTIFFKLKFSSKDEHVSFMAKDQLFQKKYSFHVIYISPLLNKKKEKRIALSCEKVRAFVKK